MSAVVMEGWLWKKKGSLMGGMVKSVTRRYCVLDAGGTLECYDDQGGELITSVKISSAQTGGKWFHIRGYHEMKLKQCHLKFQGDFDNDTGEWAEKVTQVVDMVSGQSGRGRGETEGFFFESGEKRASAFSTSKQSTTGVDDFGRVVELGEEGEGGEGDKAESGELDGFMLGDESGGDGAKAGEAKGEGEKDEASESVGSAGKGAEGAVKADVEVAKESDEAESTGSGGGETSKTADKAKDEAEAKPGAQTEGKPDRKAEVKPVEAKSPEAQGADGGDAKKAEASGGSQKSAASLWGKVASSTNAGGGGGDNSAGAKENAAPATAASRWQLGAAKAAPPKKGGGKRLYGADLLKHLAMQQVHDMRVSKEAAEMERWKAKCELGDEMNPSKMNITCFKCEEMIDGPYMNLNEKSYHKDCFSCIVCNASVAGGAYEVNGGLYCSEHRLQVHPKCHRCKRDIDGKYIVGPNRTLYHADCFSCKECNRKIRTYCEHEAEIYCVSDYSRLYASKCACCKQPLKDRIRTLQGTEEAAGLKWHESCFKCAKCNKRLASKVFFHEKKLFCEYCMKKSNLPECKKCRMPIEGACVNALDASWHPKCFVCTECKKPLKGFISKNGKPYCKDDFEKLFSKTCDLCKKPIKGPFLNALGKTFHDTCFVCCNCGNKIDGAFMKSPDDLPCCSKDCLGEYYKNVILPRKKEQEESQGEGG